MSNKTITVYLAGPIAFCSDSEANDWRDYVKAKMSAPYSIGGKEFRCDFLDPMARDYREDYEAGTISAVAAEVIELDKRDIDQSDIIFANISKHSAGTSMELLYAWERQKAVVTVLPEDVDVSPWILYHSTKVVTTLDEGIEWVQTHVR